MEELCQEVGGTDRQVIFLSLLAKNHCFALPRSENGKRWSSMVSIVTPLMVNVMHISRKF